MARIDAGTGAEGLPAWAATACSRSPRWGWRSPPSASFIALVGWRLVPARKQAGVEGFETGAYLTEARVSDDSRSAGMTLREIEQLLDETDAQVIGLVRNDVRVTAPGAGRRVRAGDILVIEAEAAALADALSRLGLKLEAAKETQPRKAEEDAATQNGVAVAVPVEAAAAEDTNGDAEKAEHSEDIVLQELAVLPGSTLAGRSASDISLRTRYSINLLAVSRHGQRSMARLCTLSLRPGDLLLMQGPPEAISEFTANFGCVPLAPPPSSASTRTPS